MVRIQFELSEDDYNRAKPYIGDEKYRHYWAMQAFDERVNRMEGRDKKAQTERILSDVKYLQELIDSGKIKLPK
jgi:hypothetical protein